MSVKRKKADVDKSGCAACGSCSKACPRKAIEVFMGMYARISADKCAGCGVCAKMCPASVITVSEAQNG